MANEFTSGPWEVVEYRPKKNLSRDAVISHSGHFITTEVGASSFKGNEHKANARLIAAAPELLEALEDILYRFCDCIAQGNGEMDDDAPAVAKARAALAKATGRSLSEIGTGKAICDRAESFDADTDTEGR